MSAKYAIIIAVLMAGSWAQTEISNILDSVVLPAELEGLKGKVDNKTVETVKNKTLTELMTRCEKNGGPKAFAQAQKAGQDLTQCMTNLVNVSELQEEIEDAKPNGTVDEVFKKYCDKKPQFEVCVKNFTESSKQCLSPSEKGHFKTVYNVSQQLAEFICFKDGDRIALFIAEGGQECFQDKQEGLRNCVNKTMGLDEDIDVNSIPDVTISFDEKQCKQILDLQSCVISVLETCPKPTSANIVESLFKFIRKSTPCSKFSEEEKEKVKVEPKNRSQKAEEPKKSSATALLFTSATIVSAILTALLV